MHTSCNRIIKRMHMSSALSVHRDFSYEFERGARIGVVGGNGCGKTTLINMLIGELELASGKREVGETTVVGHFTQTPPELPTNIRMIDYIR